MADKFDYLALEDNGELVAVIAQTLFSLSQVKCGQVDARILGDISERLEAVSEHIFRQVEAYTDDARLRSLTWRYNTEEFRKQFQENPQPH
jgi:hypothetical protein